MISDCITENDEICGNRQEIVRYKFAYLVGKWYFCTQNEDIMALAISSVPVLHGEAAERFEKKMKASEQKRGSVDFSKQIAEARKILSKAKI